MMVIVLSNIKEELYDNVIPSEQPEVMLEALELLDNVGEIKHYLKETGMSSEFLKSYLVLNYQI